MSTWTPCEGSIMNRATAVGKSRVRSSQDSGRWLTESEDRIGTVRNKPREVSTDIEVSSSERDAQPRLQFPGPENTRRFQPRRGKATKPNPGGGCFPPTRER